MYYNDSLWIVMLDHRPPGRFAPHDQICDILRAAIKSRISADMLLLRIWYSVIIHITYSLLHTCNFFQMLMQINRSNWGHLQKGALCPMLLYMLGTYFAMAIVFLISAFRASVTKYCSMTHEFTNAYNYIKCVPFASIFIMKHHYTNIVRNTLLWTQLYY